jgi:hypothetical protein
MPRPPPATATPSAVATGGIGLPSTESAPGAGAPCRLEPALALRAALSEPIKLDNRSVSVQLAAPNPINEMATTCGQMAHRSDAHMVTRSNATKVTATKHRLR